jgi:hypothetical protein
MVKNVRWKIKGFQGCVGHNSKGQLNKKTGSRIAPVGTSSENLLEAAVF